MLLAVTWLSGHVRPCFCQHEVPSCALSQSLPGRVFMEAVRESSFCLQGLWPVSPRWMWWHLGFWGLKPGFSRPQKSKHLCISLSQFSEWKLDASCLSPRWVPILLNYCWHWLCSPLTFPSLSLHPFELRGCGEGCNSGLWIPSVSRHLECAALLCEPGLPHWVQLASLISSWGPPECCLSVLGMWWYVVVSFLFQLKTYYSVLFKHFPKHKQNNLLNFFLAFWCMSE